MYTTELHRSRPPYSSLEFQDIDQNYEKVYLSVCRNIQYFIRRSYLDESINEFEIDLRTKNFSIFGHKLTLTNDSRSSITDCFLSYKFSINLFDLGKIKV